MEHAAVGRDVDLARAVVGIALEFEESRAGALNKVGFLEGEAGNFRLGSGHDMGGNPAAGDVVVDYAIVETRGGGAGFCGAGGKAAHGGHEQERDGVVFHFFKFRQIDIDYQYSRNI